MEYLMLRGIFMSPKATKDQVDYYIDLFKKVRATPDWQEFMKNGAFNTTFMTGDDYAKWVERRKAPPGADERGRFLAPELSDQSSTNREHRRFETDRCDRAGVLHDHECQTRRSDAQDRGGRRYALIALFGAIVIVGSVKAGITGAPKARAPDSFRSTSGSSSSRQRRQSLERLREEMTDCSPMGQLRQVMSVVIPTAIYVGAMPFTGLYVASIVFIGWFMRWLGNTAGRR